MLIRIVKSESFSKRNSALIPANSRTEITESAVGHRKGHNFLLVTSGGPKHFKFQQGAFVICEQVGAFFEVNLFQFQTRVVFSASKYPVKGELRA